MIGRSPLERAALARPALLRWFHKTDVTICIPAYQAANFIDRTLRFAQGQTYDHIRILVSVDRSEDGTASLCRDFAFNDRRIDVLEHSARQGWCGNVNSLLERVDTPYFFVYFHDDFLLPQYCERLRSALVAEQDAASANCDLADIGTIEAIRPGRAYSGSTARRIMTLWGVPERGTLLRSMVRSDRIGSGYRLPLEKEGSPTPGLTLLIELAAAGEAVRVPETLYMRWNREAGLTAGWRRMPFEQLVAGWSADVARCFTVIDEKVSEGADRHALKYALILHVLNHLSTRCEREGYSLPDPSDLHKDMPSLDMPNDMDRFGDEVVEHLGAMRSRLLAIRNAAR